MSEDCREYKLALIFNKRNFTRLIIDPHYQKNHPDMTDQLILELIKLLDQNESEPESEQGEFKYFAETVVRQKKCYRVVLTYCEEKFLGVVSAFRVKEKK